MSEDLIWAAGLFDGEGCIGIYNTTDGTNLAFQLGMTDEPTVARFADILDLTYIERGDQSSRFFVVAISHATAERAVRLLWPYLYTKRRQARLALIFRSTFSGYGRLSDETKLVRDRCKDLIARAKKPRK